VIIFGREASPTCIVDASEPDAGVDRQTRSIRKEIWNGSVRDRERIKWIRHWHADAGGTESNVCARYLKWIRRKRYRCCRRIEKGSCDSEIGKSSQVFVAYIAREGAIVHLTICCRKVWCSTSKVIEEVVATSSVFRPCLVKGYSRIVDTRRARIRIGINNE